VELDELNDRILDIVFKPATVIRLRASDTREGLRLNLLIKSYMRPSMARKYVDKLIDKHGVRQTYCDDLMTMIELRNGEIVYLIESEKFRKTLAKKTKIEDILMHEPPLPKLIHSTTVTEKEDK